MAIVSINDLSYLAVTYQDPNRVGLNAASILDAAGEFTVSAFGSDGIAITGIAGPTGGSALKPVGLVFIALTTKQKTLTKEYRFKGTRLSIKQQAAQKALTLLLEVL